MKLISFLFFVSTVFVSAQTNFSLPKGEAVLVYSLPKTELCIEVEIEKTTQMPGEFYRYSERYLATDNVITAESTTFRLKTVKVKTRAVADPARTYSLLSSKNLPLNNISVNERGLLRGINVPMKAAISHKKNEESTDTKQEISKPLPLTEESMLAGSIAKMAEGAAKQIYRIRESRLALLTADVDQFPADGESFKVMLKGMNYLEKELTELFIGKTTSETKTHTIYLTPSDALRNEVLFRVSSLSGLVSANDLSGSPYYINIVPMTIEVHETSKKDANNAANRGLYTILPAETQITIGDGRNTFYAEQMPMPQFGITIPIPEELLKNKDARIYVHEQTGRLLDIK